MKFNTSKTRRFEPQTSKSIETKHFDSVNRAFPGSPKDSRKSWRAAMRKAIDALNVSYSIGSGTYTVYAPINNTIDITKDDNPDHFEIVGTFEHDGSKGYATWMLPRLTAKATKTVKPTK